MNVYRRPMFLQGGGTPLPMAAPPNAAGAMAPPPNAGAGAGLPPELQMALAGAEQEGNAIGRGIGEKYVADMSDNLDSAEDYEGIINAIRGTELPISERYEELSGLVGEEDSSETPESVLALVQPAIMMTEKGAMDSGIGNLMEELAGGVQMEGGMEEGVGSLMAAGQPAEPPMGAAPMPPGPAPMGAAPMAPGLDPTALGPTLNGAPQGFAVGGAVNRFRNSPVVQNFQKGLDVNSLYQVQPTEHYYKKALGELQDVTGVDEQAKMTKANILFKISQAALGLAGGINPSTGQRMTGNTLSQFAQAASALPKTIGEELSALQAQKQKLNLAAYQSAQAQRAAAIGRATATTTAAPGAWVIGVDPKTGERKPVFKVPAKPLRALAASPHYTEFTVGKEIYRTPTFDINKPNAEEDAEKALRAKYPDLKFGRGRTYQVGTKTKATAPKEPFELTVISEDGKKATATLPPDIAAKGGPAIRKWVKANENLKSGFGGAKGEANFLKSYTVKKLGTEGSGLGTIGTPAYYSAQSTREENMAIFRDPLMALSDAGKDTTQIEKIREVMATLDQAGLNSVKGTTDLSGRRTVEGLRGPMLQAFRSRLAILKSGKYGDIPLSAEQKNLLEVPDSIKTYINRIDSTVKADEDVEDTLLRLEEGKIGSVNPSTVLGYVRTAEFGQAFGGAPALLKRGLRAMGKVLVQDWFNPEEVAGKAYRTLITTTRRAILAPLAGEKGRDALSGDFAEEFQKLEAEPESPFTTVESARIHANNIKSIVKRALRDTIYIYRAARQSGTQEPLRLKAYARMNRLEGILANWDWVQASLANPKVKAKVPTESFESVVKPGKRED